jgi:hypothetical protein
VKNTPITGFTTNTGLMLDLDRTTKEEAQAIAMKYCNIYQLEGYLLVESSPPFNFHVIFNKYLEWPQVCSYLCKIAWNYHYYQHQTKPNLTNWILLQIIKQSQTLRISKKQKKHKPKLKIGYGLQDKLIKDYLTYYEIF